MSEEVKDFFIICPYCSESMDFPTDRQLELFGWPECCGERMLTLNREKLFKLVKGLDNLKIKLEAEMIKGVL